jgi:hypothetical protein
VPRNSRKQIVREFCAGKAQLSAEEWRRLAALTAPVSAGYLQDLVADTGVHVEPPWGGVRQHSLGDLERSLNDFERVYTAARLRGDSVLASECRRVVILAKDRATRLANSLRLSEEKRSLKREMREWMLVWLENPAVFPTWVALRRQRSSQPES